MPVKQLLKYVFSSLSSSLFDILLFAGFCRLLEVPFPVLYGAIATILARILSCIYNYLFNYKLVFKSQQNVRSTLVKFFIFSAAQMLASAGSITAGLLLFPGFSEVILKAIVDTALFFLGYIIQKRYVF